MERVADITEPAIDALVARFYAKARRDPMIGPVFNDAVEDWDTHLRTLNAFWSSVMLTSGRYKGNPMAAHLKLPIEPVFFERWLALWRETATELFAPDLAAQFQAKASRIAESLKLALFYRPGEVHGAIAPAHIPA
jgi:hemoglobin